MENQKLQLNTILYAYYNDDICDECSSKLKNVNVELKYEGLNSSRWQKEKIKYCDNCNKYVISNLKIEEFNRKYPGYIVKEKDKDIPLKFDVIDIYALSKKNRHEVCNGKIRNNEFDFISERVILKNKFNLHHYCDLKKCPECNRYFATQDEIQEISKFTKVNIKHAEVVSKKSFLRNKKKQMYNKSYNVISSNAKLNVVSENVCLGDHDITEMKFIVGVKVNDTTRIMRGVTGWYCKTCNMYIITRETYEDKFLNEKLDCDLYFNYKKSILENAKINTIIKDINNKNSFEKADFLVRTNVIKCINNKHKVDDIYAEIDIIKKNGDIETKRIPAYYCNDCNLFFMYNNEYEKIRSIGIPMCSIYEYTKYIKGIDNDINFSQESLLHSFGYNVGIVEDLSEIQRRKILKFIIENGIMNKHEIISFINHLIEMRKNISSQRNAIKRWQSDCEYLKNNDIRGLKTVKINSIKVARNIRTM